MFGLRRFFLHRARRHGVQSRVNLSASPSPYSNLSVVIRCLRGAVGGWGGRGWLSQALTMLLFQRLGRICGDMERLVARYQAGRLWRVSERVIAAKRVVAEEPRCVQARLWPGRFGWLVRAASWQAAGYGCQLAHVLRQPEMVELLRASPQAGRILRPLCRALAVDAALLAPRLPGDPEEVVPVKTEPGTQASGGVVKPRVRKPRVQVDYGRIPLPRGVLAWVRRERSRKGGWK